MKKTTLTTVVRNPATLQLLLKTTDELYRDGLLSSLRVIDDTSSIDGTVELRSVLPIDGETGKSIVMVDIARVKSIDPRAVIARKLLGYHYQNTGFKLSPDGDPVTIACRSTDGCYVFVSKEVRSPTGSEIVMGVDGCFVRTGKGGGTVLVSEDFSGVVAHGTGWRTARLTLDSQGFIKVDFDNGRTMSVDSRAQGQQLEIGISSTSKGSADFVVTKLSPEEMRPSFEVDRSYASYFSRKPPRAEGLEVVSDLDVVYINKKQWATISDGSIAIAVGDVDSIPVLRRMGVFKGSSTVKESHSSFLSRSAACVERVENLAKNEIRVATSSKVLRTLGEEEKNFGTPILVCILDKESAHDEQVLAGYSDLIERGPSGEGLSSCSSDVLAYLDEVVSGGKHESFFFELVECLSVEQQKSLLNILNKKLT